MQQNGKNTASVEAFILGSLIQVSFSPLTQVINSQRAKWEVATVLQHEGIGQCLCRGFFLPVQVANGGISARHCDGSLAIIASLIGYECRSGLGA